MSFPPPGSHFLSNLSAMALMNMAPNQYQMTPMGGIMQMPMAVPGLQVPHMTMGITVPTGVTTISAPPMRKVTQDGSSLLGVTHPFFSQLASTSAGVGAVTGIVSTGPPMNHNHSKQMSSHSSSHHSASASNSTSLSNNRESNSSNYNNKKPMSNGPSITVFVGNITERASDMLIRQLLSKCGTVNNWKRVQGANGKLQGFGFCEYADPESAMRSIRLLHDFEVADKKLVVKADAKTKEKLENYLKEKSPKSSEMNSETVDQETQREDSELLNQLHGILKEHEVELSRDPDPNKAQSRRYDKRTGEPAKPENLADMDMEEEKRSLIHREIDKFRDTYKVDENDKKPHESDKLKDSKFSPDLRRGDDRVDSRSDDRYFREQSMEVDHMNNRRNRQRERTPLNKERSGRNRYDRDRNERNDRNDRVDRNDRMDRNERIDRNDRTDRDRDRDRNDRMDRNNDRNDRMDRNNDRNDRMDRNNDRNDRMDRNDRNDDRNSVHSNSERLLEDDEELQERKRLERKLREKEASYQKRLRSWEAREMRKMKEYKKYEMKQELRKEEEVKEIRKLKQFLEDYDDDRDDTKYYKGSALARRQRERQKEKEEDARDRRQEKRELEELRRKLAEEGHPDPESEAQKRLNSNENNRERDKIVSAKIKELMVEARSKTKKVDDENSLSGLSESASRGELHVKSFTFTGINKIGLTAKQAANGPPTSPGENSNPSSGGEKRKKLSVQDVFNASEDEENSGRNKKRKLPPLTDDNTDSNQSLLSNTAKSGASANAGESSVKVNMSSEEKKKQVKSLIEKIPTSKEDLFEYSIDWSLVDSTLMEKRIRPWVNKKITEYIGEEEQALLDFICSKLQAKSSAQSILDDVAMVLDDEAEVFVVKMWRLLIYEIEAKKLGIGK